ncbi:VIT1/CCC1 transporter family protein [Tomitella fengzijianii]|uniref:Rubrerythrin family protein n=1 Tax=Tomitella fengzijianii TaxID=2597660 RepID=A0A516X6B9_9ACTN|nr:VIT1/CCC1 family protein [Tomitella fengzijianii]QDQ98595.1 rubrerythrin family protein [Tomitella fengzijianii]
MTEQRIGASPAQVKRRRKRLADERAEAGLYRKLAQRREGNDREILNALAEAEERHIAHWEQLLGDEAGPVGRGGVRLRVLGWLARWFGSVFILALAQRAENRSPYDVDPDATPAMAADERVHEEVLRGLAARGRAQVSGTFRALVFGANDGLVSNLALILGVSAGGVAAGTVLLTGIAGLLSGALSMAAGEFLSIRSQRELIEASQPNYDTVEVLEHLDVDANELPLVYRARGMDADEAQAHADDVLARLHGTGRKRGGGKRAGKISRSAAVRLLRGVRPGDVDAGAGDDEPDVVGSAGGAAVSSFCAFGFGALVPVLPYLFGLTGWTAIAVGVVLASLALMMTGAIGGMLSGGPPLRRGVRQLAIGLAAALVTYGLGLGIGGVVG